MHTRDKFLKILSVMIAVIIILAGCGSNGQVADSTTPVEDFEGYTILLPDKRNLRMTVSEQKEAQSAAFLSRQEGSAFQTRLYCVDVTDVLVEADGTVCLLEVALRENRITLEEIAAYAKLDAYEGFCREFVRTRYGRTRYVYRYPEYDLRLTYDYEYYGDGKFDLINEVYVCGNNQTVTDDFSYDPDENWGLTFTAVGADNTSITLNCTQKAGQQLDTLIADFYFIDLSDRELSRLDGADGVEVYQPKPVLQRNTETEFTLDWTEIYGPLPAGDYVLTLKVSDVFDPQNRQLLSKFETRQTYVIPFTIP